MLYIVFKNDYLFDLHINDYIIFYNQIQIM